MLSLTNSTANSAFSSTRSNQPQINQPQIKQQESTHYPVVFRQSQNIPVMRSRAHRRANEKQAQKNTRVGGPQLPRTKLSQQEMARRIRQQNSEILPKQIMHPNQQPALMKEFEQIYCFDTLAADGKALFSRMASVMQSLPSYFPDLYFGPPAAEAALAVKKSNIAKHATAAAFVAAFGNNFDIRYSKTLNLGKDLKGVTVIIGEQHNHPDIERQIKRVLKNMQPSQGDLLLSEGDAQVCEDSLPNYGIPPNSCIPMEEGNPEYENGKKAGNNYQNDLHRVVKFIQSKYRPASRETVAEDVYSCLEFIKKYENSIPDHYNEEFGELMETAYSSSLKAQYLVEYGIAQREKNMLAKMKEYLSTDSTNFVVVGMRHLANLASELMQGEAGDVILMMPKKFYDVGADYSLPPQMREVKEHDEL